MPGVAIKRPMGSERVVRRRPQGVAGTDLPRHARGTISLRRMCQEPLPCTVFSDATPQQLGVKQTIPCSRVGEFPTRASKPLGPGACVLPPGAVGCRLLIRRAGRGDRESPDRPACVAGSRGGSPASEGRARRCRGEALTTGSACCTAPTGRPALPLAGPPRRRNSGRLRIPPFPVSNARVRWPGRAPSTPSPACPPAREERQPYGWRSGTPHPDARRLHRGPGGATAHPRVLVQPGGRAGLRGQRLALGRGRPRPGGVGGAVRRGGAGRGAGLRPGRPKSPAPRESPSRGAGPSCSPVTGPTWPGEKTGRPAAGQGMKHPPGATVPQGCDGPASARHVTQAGGKVGGRRPGLKAAVRATGVA